MTFVKDMEFAISDKRFTWFIGDIECTIGGEIIIPARDTENMTDEEIVAVIRYLRIPTQIEYGFYFHNAAIPHLPDTDPFIIEYTKQWKQALIEGLKHPFYERPEDKERLGQGIGLANRVLSGNRVLSQAKTPESEINPLQPPDPGFVYLVSSLTGNYKIGRTRDIKNRIRMFTVKLPFEIELAHAIKCMDCRQAEKALHQRYGHRRVKGEWFALTPEEVEEIKAITEM